MSRGFNWTFGTCLYYVPVCRENSLRVRCRSHPFSPTTKYCFVDCTGSEILVVIFESPNVDKARKEPTAIHWSKILRPNQCNDSSNQLFCRRFLWEALIYSIRPEVIARSWLVHSWVLVSTEIRVEVLPARGSYYGARWRGNVRSSSEHWHQRWLNGAAIILPSTSWSWRLYSRCVYRQLFSRSGRSAPGHVELRSFSNTSKTLRSRRLRGNPVSRSPKGNSSTHFTTDNRNFSQRWHQQRPALQAAAPARRRRLSLLFSFTTAFDQVRKHDYAWHLAERGRILEPRAPSTSRTRFFTIDLTKRDG